MISLISYLTRSLENLTLSSDEIKDNDIESSRSNSETNKTVKIQNLL